MGLDSFTRCCRLENNNYVLLKTLFIINVLVSIINVYIEYNMICMYSRKPIIYGSSGTNGMFFLFRLRFQKKCLYLQSSRLLTVHLIDSKYYSIFFNMFILSMFNKHLIIFDLYTIFII